MKIKANLFEELDAKDDKDKLVEQLYSEKIYDYIAGVYTGLIRERYGVTTRLYFSRSKPTTNKTTMAKRATRRGQIQRLIRTCVDLKVSFSFYMRAQIDIHEDWVRRNKQKFLPFSMILTDRAIEAFKAHDTTRVAGDIRPIKHYKAEEFVPKEIYLASALRHSAEVWHERILRLADYYENKGHIFYEALAKELEILTRAGMIGKTYVWTLEWMRGAGVLTSYLEEVQHEVGERLGKIERIKLSLLKKQIDKENETKVYKNFI